MSTLGIKTREVETAGGVRVTVAEVKGSIDATSAAEFNSAMAALVAAGAKHVILDCAHVNYLNSTALGALLKYQEELKRAGGGLILAKALPKVMLVAEMLGINTLLTVVATEADALRHIGDQAADASPA